MKVLLTAINSKYIHSNLAVYSLKKYAEERMNAVNTKIEIAEFSINQLFEEILSALYMKKADVYAFSCYIWNIELVKKLATELKKLCPESEIWLGGPEVSFEAESFLEKNLAVDVIMRGEGEETFFNLVTLSKTERAGIAGITYRDGDIVSNAAGQLLSMDEIPFYLETEKGAETFENRIIYYETSRGCPFSCSYCLSSIDKSVRFRDLELVKKELAYFIEKKVKQVKFVDRTFNVNEKHTLAIWEFIHGYDNGITNFHFEISADILTEKELTLLSKMRPGLVQLEIGVQSTNPETLKAIKRYADFEKIKNNVFKVNSFGNIHQHLDLIAGLPFEDYESFKRSFNEVFSLSPHQLQLGFLKVLKGSEMNERREEYGIIYNSNPPYEVLKTKWITYEEILKLKAVENAIEEFYNSRQYVFAILYALRFFENPFNFFEKLADYLENEKCGQKLSRADKYRLFRGFIVNTTMVESGCFDSEFFDEILLYDIYLRENCKKRPKWAKPCKKQSEYRKQFEGFYEELPEYFHIEEFSCDIPKSAKEGKRVGNPQAILFDYGKRSVLDNNVQTIILSE